MDRATTAWKVPRARLTETHTALGAELRGVVEQLLFGDPAAGYAMRSRVEQELIPVIGLPHVVAVHSGTIALFIALRASGIGVGDEVITVGNADISTTAAITQVGAIPVVCDVLPTDYTIDVSRIEALLTPHTRALLPVDIYGHPANVAALRTIADRHGLPIIEDAALALGAWDHDRPVGSFADVTVFSFAPYKPLGSLGNGAVVACHSAALARQLRLLVGYGHEPRSEGRVELGQHYVAEGYNVPLDPFQAAIVATKLPRFARWTQLRRQIAEQYARTLGDFVGVPLFRPESAPTFRCYAVQVSNPSFVCQRLRERGVEAVRHYTPPIAQHPIYPHGLRGDKATPVTDHLAGALVCLPVAPDLTETDIRYVCDELCACL